MANKYVLHNTVIVKATFTKLVDPFAATLVYAAYDPAAPTLTLRKPDGTELVYVYPADSAITKPSATTGKYYASILPDLPGLWRWQWKDPDVTAPGLIEGSFTITSPKIP